jgi:hypothetical protein
MYNLRELYGLETNILDKILSLEDELKRFSNVTGAEVKEIYIKNECDDGSLASHMANKLDTYGAAIRNTKVSNMVLLFVGGSDWTFKTLMRASYFPKLDNNELWKIMNFFHWIMCSLGSYNIDNMFQNDDITKNWETINCVEFFFSLAENDRNILINEYKKQCESWYNII